MRESTRTRTPGAASPGLAATCPSEELLLARAAADMSCARSSASSSTSSSSARGGRQHSTMPTYTAQHPRAVHPLAVRHSASLDLQRKDKVSERLTPRQFLDKYSLPRVVRVVSELPGVTGPLAGPLLLYRHYASTKVQARSVPGTKEVAAMGPALVIPDCYQGWFSLVTAKGQLTAQCYSSLEQLVANHVSSFLTKLELVAFKLNNDKDAHHKDAGLTRRRLQYAKTAIAAGQVVRLVAVFEDVHQPATSHRAARRLSLASIGRSAATGKKYAQCVNHKNQIVFIPLTSTGQFYAVSCGPDEPDDLRMLYQVPQLLSDYRLPLKVHLVSGSLPVPRPSGFTGTLLLEHYQEEDVILACTLPQDLAARTSGSAQPQLLEMDADSRFLLSRPLFHQESEHRLFKSQVLQAALCFCRDRGDAWRRQIKVTHHIFPPTSQQQQQQPKKAPRDRSKSRSITKKSSSFMYTSNVQGELPGTPAGQDVEQRAELGRALSDGQLPRAHGSRQQRDKLRQHSSVISALTRQLRQARLVASAADIQSRDLPSILKPPGEEIPYGRVADAVCGPLDHDENIYAEICDSPAANNTITGSKHKFRYLCLRSKNNVDTPTDDFYYVQLEGGGEAAYLNAIARLDTLTQEEEPAYDTVC